MSMSIPKHTVSLHWLIGSAFSTGMGTEFPDMVNEWVEKRGLPARIVINSVINSVNREVVYSVPNPSSGLLGAAKDIMEQIEGAFLLIPEGTLRLGYLREAIAKTESEKVF